jgi:hypothetical protein
MQNWFEILVKDGRRLVTGVMIEYELKKALEAHNFVAMLCMNDGYGTSVIVKHCISSREKAVIMRTVFK